MTVINGQRSLALTVPTLFLCPTHVISNLGSLFQLPFSTLLYLYISFLNIQYYVAQMEPTKFRFFFAL